MTARSEILVLEDDPFNRELIVSSLRDAGHDVCTDARETSDVRSSDAIRLVIVDIETPKTGGASSLRALRLRYQQARIVAISGRFHFNVGTASALARQIGADRVLAKPFDCQALLAVVRQLLTESIE